MIEFQFQREMRACAQNARPGRPLPNTSFRESFCWQSQSLILGARAQGLFLGTAGGGRLVAAAIVATIAATVAALAATIAALAAAIAALATIAATATAEAAATATAAALTGGGSLVNADGAALRGAHKRARAGCRWG